MQFILSTKLIIWRDITAEATGATTVASKFSDALTLLEGCPKNFPTVTSLISTSRPYSNTVRP